MNWLYKEYCQRENLGPFYWEQGFFFVDFTNRDFFKRDLEELRLRDLSLFTLGEVSGKTILDIGCGQGLYSMILLRLGAKKVCGQDISENAITVARKKAKNLNYDNFTGIVGDCSELQFEDDTFDLVFSGDVFEHISDDLKLKCIKEAYRVLKPGGTFTIKTPNKSYLIFSNFLHRIKAVLKLKNPFKIHIAHTKNNPDNQHHGLITHKRLERIFTETMFHFPETTKTRLNKGLPKRLSKYLGKFRIFNQHIIISARKPYLPRQ